MEDLLTYNENFTLFGAEHLWAVGLTVFFAIFLPYIAHKYLNESQKLGLSRIMALIICFWVIAYDVILVYLGKFNYKTDLPLDICNMMGLLMPILMWRPRRNIFSLFYFWILAGTLQAVITPHLYNGFPNFIFLKYWFVHGGLIVYIIYIASVYAYQLRWKDLFRAFAVLQLYVLTIFCVNKLIGSNYIYVVEKPPTASALDYLGPWPWYILVGEAIAFLLFILVFTPYMFSRPKSASPS